MIINEPKRFHIEPFSWLLRNIIEPLKRGFRGSKYVALIEPFKVLYKTFSSKSVQFSV